MVWAILLAAGESTRMGQLKALLPWPAGEAGADPAGIAAGPRHAPRQTTLLDFQLEELAAVPIQGRVVVLGHEAARLAPLVADRAEVVLNADYRTGKCSSIIAGVRAVPPTAHVLMLAVDQPRPREVLARVIESHVQGGQQITVASHAGHRGHPVIFAPDLRPDLLAISEEREGLRDVLRRYAVSVRLVEFDTPLVLVNLNTPEDYETALRLLPVSTTSSSTSSSRAGNR